MSRMLELPDKVYTALHKAACASGLTPAAWIAARLPKSGASVPPEDDSEVAGTLADLFAGRIASGGLDHLSEQTGEQFGDYLEAKRRAGHLRHRTSDGAH